jgi:hypothetical protein
LLPCQCNHDPHWLKAEIGAGRYPQNFCEVDGGGLVCSRCGGLWDHRATDRLIDLIMSGDAREAGDAARDRQKPQSVKASAA